MKARLFALAIALHGSAAAGCESAPPPPADLPARLVGAYGQNQAHAMLATVGLEVTATTLKFGDVTITIKQGAVTGPDDYRVDAAEAVWPKDSKPPKPCSGTISRQGNVLLVKLFKTGSDTRCESVLDGEWKAWSVLDTMPEELRGIYGGDARTAEADVGVRLAEKSIGFTDGGTTVAIEQVVAWVDKPGTAFLRKSSFGDFGCTGSMTLTEDNLVLALTPVEGAPAGASCPNGRGSRWSIQPKHLPAGTLDNGRVTITASGDQITLVDRQGQRCVQKILQTAARSVAGSAYDGIPVSGGAVLVLDHASPEVGAESCTARLRNVAQQLCSESNQDRCFDATSAAELPITCPRQVVIGDATAGGFKAALLPANIANLTCWDMTGLFAATPK